MASGHQLRAVQDTGLTDRAQGSIPTLLCGPEQVTCPLWAHFLIYEDGIVMAPELVQAR